MQRNPAKTSLPKLSELRFGDRTWGYVGSSRIRATLLRRIGESGNLVVYADQREAGNPGVLYISTGHGGFDLYREQRAETPSGEYPF
jgi:hypothetical protein